MGARCQKRFYCFIDDDNDGGGVDGDDDKWQWYSMKWYDAIPYSSIWYQMMVIIHKDQKMINRPKGEFVPV